MFKLLFLTIIFNVKIYSFLFIIELGFQIRFGIQMNNFLQMVSNDLFCLCKKNINLNPKYVQFYKKMTDFTFGLK